MWALFNAIIDCWEVGNRWEVLQSFGLTKSIRTTSVPRADLLPAGVASAHPLSLVLGKITHMHCSSDNYVLSSHAMLWILPVHCQDLTCLNRRVKSRCEKRSKCSRQWSNTNTCLAKTPEEWSTSISLSSVAPTCACIAKHLQNYRHWICQSQARRRWVSRSVVACSTASLVTIHAVRVHASTVVLCL